MDVEVDKSDKKRKEKERKLLEKYEKTLKSTLEEINEEKNTEYYIRENTSGTSFKLLKTESSNKILSRKRETKICQYIVFQDEETNIPPNIPDKLQINIRVENEEGVDIVKEIFEKFEEKIDKETNITIRVS